MVPRRLLFSSLLMLLAAATASAGVNQWTPLGPYGPLGGVAIFGLVVQPGMVFVTTEQGVYRSPDAGEHWDLVLATPGGVTALVADPSRPGVLYVGGFETVFRTENFGDSWIENALPGQQWVHALAVDPQSPGVLWAGTNGTESEPGRVLRSSDGGESWDEMLALDYNYTNITSMAIEPGNGSTLYVGSNGRQIWRTRDGGLNWVSILDSSPGPIGAIAIDPAEPMRVYFTSNPDVCPGICYPGVMLRTEDGGDTFTSIGPPGYPGYYFWSLLVAPDSTLYVGSGDRVWRSLDHGGSFTPVEAQTEIYADHLALDPENPSRLYAGSLGVYAIDMATDALYLQGGRFEVTVVRHTTPSGPDIPAKAVPVSDEAGYFWFFDPENVEVMVKVLDGTYVNGHFWVFYASLSNVPYTVTVTDLATGESRTYENLAGELASVADTAAFPSTSAPAATAPPRPVSEKREAESLCSPGSATLCLQDGRFQVKAFWQVSPLGPTVEARAVPLTGDTGYFYFFDEANVELVVKVLDGRGVNGHFWVFYGALSNLGYTITVTDTQTDEVRTYVNPPGKLASVADTTAF